MKQKGMEKPPDGSGQRKERVLRFPVLLERNGVKELTFFEVKVEDDFKPPLNATEKEKKQARELYEKAQISYCMGIVALKAGLWQSKTHDELAEHFLSAASFFENAIKNGFATAECYRTLGHVCTQLAIIFERQGKAPAMQKNYEKAREAFRKALELLPSDPEVHYEAGITELFLENFKGAHTFLSEAIRLNTDEPSYRFARAFTSLQLAEQAGQGEATGYLRQAAEDFLHIERLGAADSTALITLGKIFQQIGDEAKAEEYHKKAMAAALMEMMGGGFSQN
ncbi:MAG: tetratricopeptide repeat protein [Candidatus Micrarchaeota archaeon]|nr:tetratricopeptide repeat protein [Candidatus Micrarchaeota archaeon]